MECNVKSGESLVYGKKDLNKLHLPRHENFFETNVEQDEILPCVWLTELISERAEQKAREMEEENSSLRREKIRLDLDKSDLLTSLDEAKAQSSKCILI